jgi:hypothetical protein
MGYAGKARAAFALLTATGAAILLLLIFLLGSARSAPARSATAGSVPAGAGLPAVPRPAPLRGLAQARADRPDPATAPTHRARGFALPTGTWKPLGPAPIGPPYASGGGFYGGVSSGRITAITTIPSGALAGRLVAGTAGGGIWTSSNNGTDWTARSDTRPDLAIGALAVDPNNPDHLIAGTGEANQCADCYSGDGIMVSTNGGTSWSAPQNPGAVFTGTHIAQVAIDPSNSNHQFAATDGGLYVTTNGGATWAKPTSSTYTAVDGNITAVVINPKTPSIVYIGGGAKAVAKSTNGGTIWAPANTGITIPAAGTDPLIALALAPSSPATLYASVGTNLTPVAVYKSINSGGNWTKLTATPDFTGQAYSYGSGTDEQGGYDNVVAVDPTNANHVLAGGIAQVETKNGGTSWTNVNGGAFFSGVINKIHPDQHALAFSGTSVWIGNDGGVFRYTPSTGAVANTNGNLNITQFYYGFNVVAGTVLAGSQDNATARTSSSTVSRWTGIASGDGGPSQITPNAASIQFLEANQNLYVTTDAFATTRRNITPPAFTTTGALFTPPELVIANKTSPTSPTVFYGGQDLYRTTNPTASSPTWTKVTSLGSNCKTGGTCVSAIARSPNNPSVIYVGFTNGVIAVSTNGGTSFTQLKSQSLIETFVTGISVDPANPKAITVSFSYNRTRSLRGLPHVEQYSYTTSPGTGTWRTITGTGLPVSAVSRVVYDSGSLLAATDSGVYGTSAPSGSSTRWTKVGAGLPNVQTQDLVVTNAVYVLTHGRGAWRLP